MSKHIVIVGGGVAGCAMAIAAHSMMQNIEVTIIEKSDHSAAGKTLRIGETLHGQIVVLLQRLGLWQSFLACDFLKSYGTAAVWGQSEPYYNESISSPYGFGWHLDRNAFDCWLVQQVQARGMQHLDSTELTNSQYEHGQWRCQLTSLGTKKCCEITCDFIIDATGRQASFAKRQNSKRLVDDKLIALYQFISSANIGSIHAKKNIGIDSCTLIESHCHGWWYSARLPNQNWLAAFMCDSDIATKQGYKSAQHWLQNLQASSHTQQRLGAVLDNVRCEPPSIIAAHSQQLNQCVGQAWLAVGDAASAYDPLSSLGIFKAFRTAILASYALTDYFSERTNQKSTGADSALKNIPKSLLKYQHIVKQEYQAFKIKQQEYYAEETRYDTLFWQRRRALAVA